MALTARLKPRPFKTDSDWDLFRVSLNALDYDGGAVGEDFGDALHEVVGVVVDSDDSVGTVFGGVLHHAGEGVLAGLFAELGEDGDVASYDGLQARAEGSEDGTGADDDATDDTEVADDTVAGQILRGGDHGGIEDRGRRGVGGHK